MMLKKNLRYIYGLILCIYAVGLVFERAYTETVYLYKSLIVFGSLCFFLMVQYKIIRKKELARLLLFVILAYFSFSIGVLIYGFDVKSDAFSALVYIFAIYFVSRFIVYYGYDYMFFLTMYFSLIYLFLDAFIDYGYNQNYYDFILHNGSRNVVSSWALCLSSIIVVVKYKNENIWVLWPLMVSLFVAYVCGTRASLFIMVLIVLVVAYYKYGIKFIVLFLPLLGYLIYRNADILMNWYTYTKFASNGFESERYYLWNDYLNGLDISGYVFGIPLDKISFIKELNTNPHNSFLRIHSFFGMIPVVYVCVVFIVSYKMYDKPILIVFFLVLLRGFTDIIFWDGVMDLVFFGFIFIVMGFYSKSACKSSVVFCAQ